MKSGWETRSERLRRWIKIPIKKKLEWLRMINEFTDHALPSKIKKIRLKIRRQREIL